MSGTISFVGAGADDAARARGRNIKQAIFKNCAPFIYYITKINNMLVHIAQDLDVVVSIYNLIEYSDNYSKTSGSLYQFCRDQLNDDIADSESFKFKSKFL